MTSSQISIRREVYEKLKYARYENESFSDIIERLLSEQSNRESFLKLHGIAHDDDDEQALAAFEAGKKEIREVMNRRYKTFDEA
jgi:predicted CopG family antitoxin